jgi:hypothetical protein
MREAAPVTEPENVAVPAALYVPAAVLFAPMVTLEAPFAFIVPAPVRASNRAGE